LAAGVWDGWVAGGLMRKNIPLPAGGQGPGFRAAGA
jgi:hypothetical protein